ncbi:efflux RND transporter permease subunit, partial [Candidatus Sumerlaeota bacterium]|nr:efflux RND transporter permease subunit [Candidatus Sumerlaeota bacterium]
MNLIDLSVKNATAVVVGMILVVLFGALAYDRIPVQLNPTIDQPIITIETDYPGAAPSEVESEITRRQEGRLAAVENVRRMRSISREGQAEVTLEFDWGTDKGFAGQDVSKKLDLV